MVAPKTIHTLNARDNVMLGVMRDYFKLSSEQMFHVIQDMRGRIEAVLSQKQISYDKLRSALVPAQDRREIALIFDTTAIESSWYGFDVMKQVIPLFEKKSNHSVLVGDYLDHEGHKKKLFRAFEESVQLRRDVVYRHPTQFFIVYINNLTDAMVGRFDRFLRGYRAYAGIADMTYASTFKLYLSTMLANSFIKHGKFILQGHEPDRSDTEDINMSNYPFEENGYACRSVSSDLMGVLLSYKIERPVIPGFETDTEFALNAVSVAPMALDKFEIEIADAKLEYLKRQKASSIARAGLEAISTKKLTGIIRTRISANYIYNLGVDREHNVTKFNIILELPAAKKKTATRFLAAFEYQPGKKTLRLITLY